MIVEAFFPTERSRRQLIVALWPHRHDNERVRLLLRQMLRDLRL